MSIPHDTRSSGLTSSGNIYRSVSAPTKPQRPPNNFPPSSPLKDSSSNVQPSSSKPAPSRPPPPAPGVHIESTTKSSVPPALPTAPKPTVLPRPNSPRKESDQSDTRPTIPATTNQNNGAKPDYNTPKRGAINSSISTEDDSVTLALKSEYSRPPPPNRSISEPRIKKQPPMMTDKGKSEDWSEEECNSPVFNIHIATPKLDVWKKLRFPTTEDFTVKSAVQFIAIRSNVNDYYLHSYILRVVYSTPIDGQSFMTLEDGMPLKQYQLNPNDVIEFRLKPNPMTSKFTSISLANLAGEIESTVVDLAEPASQLLNFACMKYKYNLEEIFLEDTKRGQPIMPLRSLKDQGISEGSSVTIRKKGKREIQQHRESMANIRRGLGSVSSKGAALQVVQDFSANSMGELTLRKGDRIVVLEEHETGWWRGVIGDRVGVFPVHHCKYISVERKQQTERDVKMKEELEKGLLQFGNSRVRPMAIEGKMRKLMFWKKKQNPSEEGMYGFERYNPTLPVLVKDTLDHLIRIEAFKVEGLFRVSGDLTQVWDLKKKYLKEKPVDLTGVNVHTVAGVLKGFLRDLPEPLFTFELYDAMVAAVRIADERGRLHCIAEGLSVLPPGNKEIVHHLFSFFYKQTLNADTSKMTASNISIVFAPSLIRPEVETVESLMSDEGRILIETLVKKYKEFFVEKKWGNRSTAKMPMPTTPEFDHLLHASSVRIEHSIVVEKEKRSTFNENSSPRSTAAAEEDSISPMELVECLLEGNTANVESYLSGLPEPKQERLRKEVDKLFEAVMSERGIEGVVQNT